MVQQPGMCRPQAYYLFAEQVPIIDSTDGLLNAAIAISMHALDDVDPAAVRRELRELADQVRQRVHSQDPEAILAHLHEVLFEEVGFRGNTRDYYNPHNSYLPSVVESRHGIPITLALVYKAVAERVGLDVEGVNAPGHFLVRIQTDHGPLIVDPFVGGGVLTEEEAFQRAERVTGRPVPRAPQYLAPASHVQWLSRILVNLQHVFASTDRPYDLAAMSELQSVLDYSVY